MVCESSFVVILAGHGQQGLADQAQEMWKSDLVRFGWNEAIRSSDGPYGIEGGSGTCSGPDGWRQAWLDATHSPYLEHAHTLERL